MSGRRSTGPRSATSPTVVDSVRRNRMAAALAGMLCCLVVAQPLVSGEFAASEGSGLPLVMLLLVTACGLPLYWLLSGQRTFRVHLVDCLVLGFFAWQAVATVANLSDGAPRPATNLLWESIALGLVYLLARQLIPAGPPAGAVMTAMLALSLSLAMLGFEQYFFSLPEARAAYAADPEGALRAAGVDAPAGSPQRWLFEQRLASTEPMARFELANSLAGVLATWLVVLAAGVVLGRREWKSWLVAASVAVPIAICLLLTKSRSAYLATGLGFVALAYLAIRQAKFWNWRWLAGGALVMVLLIAAAWGAGGLDREVLSEAPKSLGYRLQYWQSTAAMVADHPLLGVGQGNFRGLYTSYKLPTASEEIADPHNFLMEVAAHAGLPGVLLLLAALAGVGWVALRRPETESLAGNVVLTHTEQQLAAKRRAILIGACWAPLVAWVACLATGLPLSITTIVILIVSLSCGVLLLRPWGAMVGDSPLVPLLGAGVLLVNLLAAGGIGFPGVAGSLWLLLALAVSLSPAGKSVVVLPRWAPPLAIAGGVLLLGLCYTTAYRPVMVSQAEVLQAQSRGGTYAEQRERYERAATADPLSARPFQMLSALETQALLAGVPVASRQRLFESTEAMLRRDPHASSAHAQVGDWYLALAWDQQQSPPQRQEDLQRAVAAYEQSVNLYPTDPTRQARLAVTQEMAGDTSAAQATARRALELHRGTPHLDKQLTPELLASVERIAQEPQE